jgi:hypothetical protein
VFPLVVAHGTDAPVAGVGRAVALAQRVLGGTLAGVADVSTVGPPPGSGWSLAEAAGHPWLVAGPPAVTVVAAVGWAEVVYGQVGVDDDVATLTGGVAGMAHTGRSVVAVMPPEAATRLAGAGWDPARLSRATDGALRRVIVAGGVGVKGVVVPVWGASEPVRAPVA